MHKIKQNLGIVIGVNVIELYNGEIDRSRRITLQRKDRIAQINLFNEDMIWKNHQKLCEINRQMPTIPMVRQGMLIIGDEDIYGGLLLYCYGDVSWANVENGSIAYMDHDPDRYSVVCPQDILQNEKCG